MKIGLIADIHCDVDGLKRALDLFHRRGVDSILCAGDLVEKGKGCDGNVVVEIIQASGIPSVKGNHDHSAAFNQQWLRENYDPRHPKLADLFLNETTLTYLSDLPETLSYEWYGRRVLMAHGTPWNRTMYLYASSPRMIYENMTDQTDADLIILGHTHRPMNIRFCNRQVVNPGSVCGHWIGGSGTCGILTLPDSCFEVYDLETGSQMNIAQTILD
jgi:putative phosphoesterase